MDPVFKTLEIEMYTEALFNTMWQFLNNEIEWEEEHSRWYWGCYRSIFCGAWTKIDKEGKISTGTWNEVLRDFLIGTQ